METIKIALDPGATMPTRAHVNDDAGLDLYAAERKVIRANDRETVSTGTHVQIPRGYVGFLTSKSGLMAKGLTSRGTIDAGYTGTVQAVLFNHGHKDYIVEKGDKITQMVIVPIVTPMPELVEKLEETERGAGGFGSTGR